MMVINKMNLSRMNLNLLVALDVLLTERHVTRAGKKLHISQSAMSSILKQLREIFQDELFVRGAASSMIPTPRALELIAPLKEALAKTELIFQRTELFNPALVEKTIVIAMSDYTEFIILPLLIQKIAELAPKINIVVKHLNFLKPEHIFGFENNTIDLALGIYTHIPASLEAMTLFADEVVCVGDAKNSLLHKKITLKQFALADHLVVLFYENILESYTEQLLQKEGYERRIVATVPHTLPALYALPNTHLVAVILEKVVKKMAKSLHLKSQPVPFSYPKATVSLVWHPKDNNDSLHKWLRLIIQQLAYF